MAGGNGTGLDIGAFDGCGSNLVACDRPGKNLIRCNRRGGNLLRCHRPGHQYCATQLLPVLFLLQFLNGETGSLSVDLIDQAVVPSDDQAFCRQGTGGDDVRVQGYHFRVRDTGVRDLGRPNRAVSYQGGGNGTQGDLRCVYVFRGLGCFSRAPQIITDDDYKSRQLSAFESDIRIFVYNIDKFNKEDANMKKVNEIIGDSFYQYLSSLPDLVLIMDESHHYRAERGAAALNELHPLLGLELTATPLVTKGSKQEPFKNVVYEYPLSKAIEDGYTRTPFAVTRTDIDFYNFGDEQLDKMMLTDGIACHERTKTKLEVYAANHGKPVVKPFMLVVCKDTDHAVWVENYIRSDEFREGAYREKTIIVHSKQKGSETEANTRLLLGVENPGNPVEIVIHVNMLKEGWDVNNLYTIVPLRTAASKILREQMVGRGLRLPYGERTNDPDVDAVMLTAHDKFQDILDEAQRGDSIFKAGNVIKAEDIVPEQISFTQLSIPQPPGEMRDGAYAYTNIPRSEQTDAVIDRASDMIQQEVSRTIQNTPEHTVTPQAAQRIAETVAAQISENRDLGDIFRENEMPLTAWLLYQTEQAHVAAKAKFIPIPRIKITDTGVEEYVFLDFDLDLADFTHIPIRNELLIQNLEDMNDRKRIKGDAIDFEGYNPKKVIVEELRKKPEIDYEKCSALLFKLITQLCDHYVAQHGENGMRNIVMMYKRDIGNKIYAQMLHHFYCKNGFLQEEVIGTRSYNLQQSYSYKEKVGLYSFQRSTVHIQDVTVPDHMAGVAIKRGNVGIRCQCPGTGIVQDDGYCAYFRGNLRSLCIGDLAAEGSFKRGTVGKGQGQGGIIAHQDRAVQLLRVRDQLRRVGSAAPAIVTHGQQDVASLVD
ncbi:MAG: DEAD/DEAH box helicase family protein [Clostridia bacterium]|nr:DEAD/DEAH box helicase family protein [Clostridia bacterium]